MDLTVLAQLAQQKETQLARKKRNLKTVRELRRGGGEAEGCEANLESVGAEVTRLNRALWHLGLYLVLEGADLNEVARVSGFSVGRIKTALKINA